MLTSKELATKIASVSRRNKTLRQDIQAILVQISAHVYSHGDTRSIPALLNATVGQDKVAIIKWLTAHAFVRFDKDGNVELNKTARKGADFDSGDAVIESLADVAPWYENAVTNAKAAQVAKEEALLDRLIKSMEKAQAEGRFERAHTSVFEAKLARLVELHNMAA